jgi:hypothetical protein
MNDLVLSNLTILLAVAGIVILLILVQLFLAIQQDKAVAAAGPLAEIDALQVQIDGLRDSKNDYEAELDKFRKTLAEQAELRSEIDYLVKRRDELQIEWSSLDEKRQELASFNVETEKSQISSTEIEETLKKARQELDSIKEKLIEKDELDSQLEALKKSKITLGEETKRLTAEVAELKQVKADSEQLQQKLETLNRDVASLEGTKLSREQELETLVAEVQKHKTEIAEYSTKLAKDFAEYEVTKIELNTLKNEKERITAELEVVKAQIQKETGKLGVGGDPDKDPLEELKTIPPVILNIQSWSEANFESEVEALNNVKRRFEAVGLVYHDRVLNAFHTTMKTNETTQLAVLAGISGTGKSQLPRQYASGMGIGFLQVPVQPRWDSPQDLMGFYNYIEGKFKPTDMARALWSLDIANNEDAIDGRMLMVLLDEMNLSRVEYYFSDFLSRLESRPSKGNVSDKTLRKDAEIELEIPNSKNETVRLFPGYNLLFAGTMNEDETTQSLSDKVIDRANILRFGAPSELIEATEQGNLPEVKGLQLEKWNSWVRPVSDTVNDAQIVNGAINYMSTLMLEFGRPFGHRLALAIKSYVANYPYLDGIDRINVALADQVELRLLPKLRGVDVEDYAVQFSELKRFVQDQLNDLRLAEAIEKSVEASERNSQFKWYGVTR